MDVAELRLLIWGIIPDYLGESKKSESEEEVMTGKQGLE